MSGTRRSGVLKGIDPDRGRRDRQNNIIAARTNAREERLNHRRKLGPEQPAMSGLGGGDANSDIRRTLEQLPQTVEKLLSNDVTAQLEATTCLRKLLSLEKKPPIEEVVHQPNVVQRLVQFLQMQDNQKLQFEAAWALTNIASGTSEHTQYVIECGAVPIFVAILTSPSEEVREQAVWALGNIAGDNAETRDLVLQNGAMNPLLQLLSPQSGSSKSMVRNATWTLSNFCRGKPAPAFEHTRVALPTLKHLIMQNDMERDDEILTDACWALSYLSDGPNERIQAVVQANITRRLVELLGYDKDAVLVPALRTVGNIVTGTDEQTQSVINCGALQALSMILQNAGHYKKSIIKEACWTVSNITAGTKDQITAVLQSHCIEPIVHLLTHGELEIKREAAWAISNATSGGEQTHIQQLVQYGCIKPLSDLMRIMDQRVVQVALEGLKNILAAGERLKDMPGSKNQNIYGLMLEETGGLDLLENLQNHTSTEIAEKALDILQTYFEATTDVEGEGGVPAVGTQGMYDFNAFSGGGAGGLGGMKTDDSQSGGEAAFNFGGV